LWRLGKTKRGLLEEHTMSLVIGIAGLTLAPNEVEWLARKQVAGVILFTRNFANRTQLTALVAAIRDIRKNLIVCVDQEGGRVQRFREGFVALPALAQIGALHARKPGAARRACMLHAKLMAVDILSTGIDLSFAPVADLARGNLAIGDRAFSDNPEVCAELSTLYAATMQAQGMAATLKHFPGHGSVQEDTHFDLAQDLRPATEIFKADLLPFATGILAEAKAIMTAHVSYPKFDSEAAGYSKLWLNQVLRVQLGFKGVIFSDDVGMAGGANVGTLAERVKRHYRAGCDLILVCSTAATAEVMAQVNIVKSAKRARVKTLRAQRTGRARRMIGGAKFIAMQERLSTLLGNNLLEPI
jgi:beta-N-acetylhexosaminidase